MTDEQPLVSCLCVTHDRVPLLRRAVACFQAQDWPSRELLLLHEPGDHATASFAASLQGDARIRVIRFPAGSRLSLGEKRNIALQAARGTHTATWDDDDWHAPSRLSAQMAVLGQSGADACTLRNMTVFDSVGGRAYISESRPWEPTVVVRRGAMPPYPAISCGEDLPGVGKLAAEGRLVALPQPQLYIYNYHGNNTVSRNHIRRNILGPASPLGPEGFRIVGATLAGQPGPALEQLLASLQPGSAIRP